MVIFVRFFIFLALSFLCGASDLSFKVNEVDLDLVSIVAGQVNRSAEGDSLVMPDPLYAGKYLVTQDLWQAVMGANPSHFKSCGLDCPVESVSWDDIVESNGFLDMLNAMTGCYGLSGSGETRYKPEGFPAGCFRLPTADESEYAHRAGSGARFPWGDDDSFATVDQYAWYSENVEPGSGIRIRPVGQKLPNAWGLYDASGNAWEWVYTAASDRSKVRRGGGGIIMPTP
jgi:formylglycine-generating enzyme required for sulfatase activity